MSCTTPVLLCATKYYSNTTPYYKYYSVLQSTIPILPWTTKYYSSTTLYYKVLLQYYSVLQILLCTTKYYSSTTKYYSSTTLYYKVLLQCYSVLQILLCTTPVLPCTTKYYSSTTLYYSSTTKYYSSTNLYYKVLLQYYPVLLQYYKVLHDWSASHMKRHLHCAEQQKAASNFSKYCACHAKWISWLIHITYETSFTIKQATSINLQPHQILRLPRKMNLMIDPHHIWNVIYNARSNRQHPPTSLNTAPATQNGSHDRSASHMKRHLQCA